LSCRHLVRVRGLGRGRRLGACERAGQDDRDPCASHD
jgi:hypothetical protein